MEIEEPSILKRSKQSEKQGARRFLDYAKSRDSATGTTLRGANQLLPVLVKETKLLHRVPANGTRNSDDTKVLSALVNIAAHQNHWIRQPEDYRSKSHNAFKQLDGLIAHLFAKYPTPTSLNVAFNDSQSLDTPKIYIFIANGGNIRKSPIRLLPDITKTQAHIFHTSPANTGAESLLELMLRAKALSHGVEDSLILPLIKNRSVQDRGVAHSFWEEFFGFLGRQGGMIAPNQVGPLCDYLHHVRSTPEGRNYSFKGRTLAALTQRMLEWHTQLTRARVSKNRTWNPSTRVTPFRWPINPEEPATWTIEEITTEKGLLAEGRAMHHCVYSYTDMCVAGKTSIWSMQHLNERQITIEISGSQVVQARGKYNAALTNPQKQILQLWGNHAQISVGRFL